MSAPDSKNLPVFNRELIDAMTQIEQEVADMLEREGRIRIVGSPGVGS